jgi:hypothetical protein
MASMIGGEVNYLQQLLFAAAWAAVYVAWSYLYFRALDPIARRVTGNALGVRIVWADDARQYFVQGRYRRWHWGIADAPADYVSFVELLVQMAEVAIVNVLAGLWPVAILYAALVTGWPGPIAAYLGVLLAIPIYSIYWAGRYRPVIAGGV